MLMSPPILRQLLQLESSPKMNENMGFAENQSLEQFGGLRPPKNGIRALSGPGELRRWWQLQQIEHLPPSTRKAEPNDTNSFLRTGAP